jgi:hypothetical protein
MGLSDNSGQAKPYEALQSLIEIVEPCTIHWIKRSVRDGSPYPVYSTPGVTTP